jgi:hypothetical protein
VFVFVFVFVFDPLLEGNEEMEEEVDDDDEEEEDVFDVARPLAILLVLLELETPILPDDELE